jgi:hypothetical protein
MNGGNQLLDEMRIQLRDVDTGHLHTLYIDVYDTSLSRKWYAALNDLLANNNHLEKNYCFLGFAESPRNGQYILDQVNHSIDAINLADIGYRIDDNFTLENSIEAGPVGPGLPGRKIIHDKFNWLHRYFEDLQGTSGSSGSGPTDYYLRGSPETRWHIRQLNLLCHEFESWALSYRKIIEAPEWQRPSQLMCWINAPRFELTDEDLDSFGMDALVKDLGGVTVGVNKAVGKHHYEVFTDEGDNYDRATDTSITTVLRAQSQAAGDFDIEWGKSTRDYSFQIEHLEKFRAWLIKNGWDPEDPQLTLGHPKVAQVDLIKSFGVDDPQYIWETLYKHLDVYSVQTSEQHAEYPYHWSDVHYMDQQVNALTGR